MNPQPSPPMMEKFTIVGVNVTTLEPEVIVDVDPSDCVETRLQAVVLDYVANLKSRPDFVPRVDTPSYSLTTDYFLQHREDRRHIKIFSQTKRIDRSYWAWGADSTTLGEMVLVMPFTAKSRQVALKPWQIAQASVAKALQQQQQQQASPVLPATSDACLSQPGAAESAILQELKLKVAEFSERKEKKQQQEALERERERQRPGELCPQETLDLLSEDEKARSQPPVDAATASAKDCNGELPSAPDSLVEPNCPLADPLLDGKVSGRRMSLETELYCPNQNCQGTNLYLLKTRGRDERVGISGIVGQCNDCGQSFTL